MWEWIRNRHVLNTSVILQARDHCQKVAKNIANPGARANLPNGHSHAEAVRLGAWAFHQHVICIDMIQLLSNLLFLYVFVFQTKSRAKIIPGALAQTGLCNHPSTCRRCIRHLNGWIGDVSAENFGGMKRVEGYPISSEDCQVPHVYSWLLFPRVSHTIWFYLCIYLIDSICISIYLLDWIVFMFLCFFVCFLASVFPCLVVFRTRPQCFTWDHIIRSSWKGLEPWYIPFQFIQTHRGMRWDEYVPFWFIRSLLRPLLQS